MTESYLHLPSGELRPRHTEFGATLPAIPDTVHQVRTGRELRSALTAIGRGTGGHIQLLADILIDEPLQWVDNVRISGAAIRASELFSGAYMLNVLHVRHCWFDAVELDANGMDGVNCASVRASHNIVFSDCRGHDGKTGIYIERGSSDITIVGGSYHDNHMHGIAIDDKECHSIAVLSARMFANGAFGFDTHSIGGELAGCLIYSNGQQGGSYGSAGIKLPEARSWYVHDNQIRTIGAGPRAAVWTYGDERESARVNIYRNSIYADGGHLVAGKNKNTGRVGELLHCDNAYHDANGAPTDMRAGGSGRIVENVDLRDPVAYPYEIDDKTHPVPPPPETAYITAAEAEAIALSVFEEQMKHLHVEYRPSASSAR